MWFVDVAVKICCTFTVIFYDVGPFRRNRFSWWGREAYLVIGCFCVCSNGWCRLAAKNVLELINRYHLGASNVCSTGHGPTCPPQWWYLTRKSCKGEEYCAKKVNTVWITPPSCFIDVYAMSPIVLRGRTNIQYFHPMYCPTSSNCWFLM